MTKITLLKIRILFFSHIAFCFFSHCIRIHWIHTIHNSYCTHSSQHDKFVQTKKTNRNHGQEWDYSVWNWNGCSTITTPLCKTLTGVYLFAPVCFKPYFFRYPPLWMAALTSLRLLFNFLRIGCFKSDLPHLTPPAAAVETATLFLFSRLGIKYHHKEVHTTAKSLSENTARHPTIIIKTEKFIAVLYPWHSPVAFPVMVPFLSPNILSFLGWELDVV